MANLYDNIRPMKLRKILIPFVSSCAFAFSMSSFHAQAIEIDDLYQAKVAYSGDNGGREKAYRQAFKQVLVKLAGSDFVNDSAELKKAINKPNAYLSEYRFDSQDEQTFLFANFESAKVDQLLQQVNAGIWGKHRPLLTVWMIDEQGSQRTLIDDSNEETKKQLQLWFNQRGIAVNFPIMDLTDAMAISNSDVWGRFEQSLLPASERYMAEAVLVLRISDSTLINEPDITACGNNCQTPPLAGDWQLWSGDLNLANNKQGKDKDKLLQSLVFDVAENLHQQYSVIVSSDSDAYIDIEIANVTTMKDFVAVSDFFSNVSLVDDVVMIKVSGTKMLFRLHTKANVDAIMRALNLEQNLVVNQDPLVSQDTSEPVSFYWKG
ncbi:DUF2066 domain-containing protein [Thalassotalea sp. HSM 43]|nr:DUF2066 domain-containing protein [Thalassotalea sp. HSM 43]